MQQTHSITIYIDKDKIIEEMTEYHRLKWQELWNRQSRGKLPARERQRLSNQALVHKDMIEFWKYVTFEPLNGETSNG